MSEAKRAVTDVRSILRCGINAGPTTALRWTIACIPAANTSSLLETCTQHQLLLYNSVRTIKGWIFKEYRQKVSRVWACGQLIHTGFTTQHDKWHSESCDTKTRTNIKNQPNQTFILCSSLRISNHLPVSAVNGGRMKLWILKNFSIFSISWPRLDLQ